MIMERTPPLVYEDLNEIQLHMLKQCDIPGLLPLETEECDGQISLRYSLSGTRMLTEAIRSSHWSMAEMMGALCRLAEVLEECRLYLLDPDRIRLQDDFIFVGNEWHDLKFTYLPIDMPTLFRADDLERLIIRWMMKVKEPDGQALQNVLRLAASPDFTPIVLSRYTRQYLSGSSIVRESDQPEPQVPALSNKPIVETRPTSSKSSRTWDFLQPVSGDLHPVSELWGDTPDRGIGSMRELDISAAASTQEDETIDMSRWRVIVMCVSFVVIAFAWRFIYLSQPREQTLLICLCITLVCGAGVILLWSGSPQWLKSSSRSTRQPIVRPIESAYGATYRSDQEANEERWAFPRFSSPQISQPSVDEPSASRPDPVLETSWIPTRNDQTELLDHNGVSSQENFCLVWKSKDKDNRGRIPLEGNSLIIGRSAEAAQHVDETTGISRAHVELLRVSEQWKVKDLGSRNGTRLNDKPMAPYELYALQTGDCLTLAQSQYLFQRMDG